MRLVALRDGARALGDLVPVARSQAWLCQQVLGSGYRAQPCKEHLALARCSWGPHNNNHLSPRHLQRPHSNKCT